MKGIHNQELKKKIKEAGLTFCELGYLAGLSEATTFRWLRYPLDKEKQQTFNNVLEKVALGGNA